MTRPGANDGRCGCHACGCADGCEASASVTIGNDEAQLDVCPYCAREHPAAALACHAGAPDLDHPFATTPF